MKKLSYILLLILAIIPLGGCFEGETVKGTVVTMNNVNNSIPASASKEWQEELKQYYVEYTQGAYVYKMWVEDEASFTEKMNLAFRKK